jgi:hypothetical protein
MFDDIVLKTWSKFETSMVDTYPRRRTRFATIDIKAIVHLYTPATVALVSKWVRPVMQEAAPLQGRCPSSWHGVSKRLGGAANALGEAASKTQCATLSLLRTTAFCCFERLLGEVCSPLLL